MIVYTTYGGFHAVVWTDVMQGVVMVVGVVIMLPLAINQAGEVVGQDRQGSRARTGHPGHGQDGPSTKGDRDHCHGRDR